MKPVIKRRAVSALVTAGMLLALAVALNSCKLKFVYYPTGGFVTDPGRAGLAYEEVLLQTEDDETVHGWWVPAEGERGVVLFCHGNAGNISHRIGSLEVFNDMELSVFIFDYRGYGRSTGKPSEHGTYRDARAAWEYLAEERKIPPGKIIVFGRSLGGAVALRLGREKSPAMVIAESTFTSVYDVVSHHYSPVPAQLFYRKMYRSIDIMEAMPCPVLVVHSRGDEIVPYELGRKLYEAAPEPKTFLEIRGSHNSGFMDSLPGYRAGLEKFIGTHLP